MQDLTVRLAELKRQHAQLSTTFTPEYLTVKQIRNQIEEIEAVLARERERGAQRITNGHLAAVRRENLLRQAFEEEQDRARGISEKLVQYNILKREVETNKSLYVGLIGRLKQTVVSAEVKFSNNRIIDAAEPPARPAKPKWLLNLALAVFLGLGLGIGAAFFREFREATDRS